MTQWQADAPSNIALIKYMGKVPNGGNRPTNASLSYTLNHLTSTVQLELRSQGPDVWEPLLHSADEKPLVLSEKGQKRFLDHWQRLKAAYEYNGCMVIRSRNNFPSDCGLASSASSFAALTRVAFRALHELTGRPLPSWQEQAEWSRQGSGSSCRSLADGWVLWNEKGVQVLGLPSLLHQVVIVEESQKEVSSSEAHQRVSSSLLFEGRPARAEKRLNELSRVLSKGAWKEAHDIVWAEFWDMHALFETAHVPFGYMTSGSLQVLQEIRHFWRSRGDGPLVTMDAGANIHLLYRADQATLAGEIQTILKSRFRVMTC